MRRSTPQIEGLLQVSKWLKAGMLLTDSEMRALFAQLGDVHLIQASCPVQVGEEEIGVSSFCDRYAKYLTTLDSKPFQTLFSCAISKDLNDFYAMTLPGNRLLVKPIRPVIQMQALQVFYSRVDGEFHPMVQGKESFSWGIQFSYPQLYQDPKTRKVVKVSDAAAFPNTPLFNELMRWMRKNTMPTPFIVDGIKKNSVIRLGREAISLADRHPQLQRQQIVVDR